MKRTVQWMLFAMFIVYFGCKQKSSKFTFIDVPKYDTTYYTDSAYDDLVNSVRAKHGQPAFKGPETNDLTK